MKKIDNATGLTIEVPSDEPRGAFPFFGFWQEAYPQLVSHIQRRKKVKAARGDIAAALNNLSGMVNGPYRVIIADRLYKIGETLRLNPQIPAHGSGGPSISYIKETSDGGRMDIAAIAFEYPIDIMIQTARSSGSVSSELSKLNNDIQTTSLTLRQYNEQFFALQAKIPSQNLLKKMEGELSLLEKDILKLEAEYVRTQNIKAQAQASSQRMQELSRLQSQLKSEAISTQNSMQSKLQTLHKLENKQSPNAVNQFTGNIISARRDVQRLGRKNQDVQHRLQTISIELSRMISSRDFDNEMRELELACRTRLSLLNKKRNDQAGLSREFDALVSERTETINALTDIQARMRGLSNQLAIAQSQYDKAQSAMGQVGNTREDEIVRNWANHLNQMQREVEQRLFANLAKAAAAQRGSPLSREVEGVILDAGTIKDYEDYLTALEDISDALEYDEYDLLEMIGKLGAAQQYVPGPTRLYALIQPDMNRRKRMEAYRNIITEILTSGAAATASYERGSININIPGFGPVEIGREKPLNELQELVRHLSNAGLEFDYESSRGGN